VNQQRRGHEVLQQGLARDSGAQIGVQVIAGDVSAGYRMAPELFRPDPGGRLRHVRRRLTMRDAVTELRKEDGQSHQDDEQQGRCARGAQTSHWRG
jgi:hypothetical protein